MWSGEWEIVSGGEWRGEKASGRVDKGEWRVDSGKSTEY